MLLSALALLLALIAPASPVALQASAAAGRQGGPAPTLEDALALLPRDAAAAAKLLARITEREPKNARAWRALGFADRQLKAYDAAIKAYRTSLALEPGNATALYNLGCVYALAGDRDQAFAFLERASATHAMDMTLAAVDPDLAPLRDDPRFEKILPTKEQFEHPFVEPVKIVREWDGEAAGDQFGWIARNIGDVDGDGVADVVTSAPTHASGGEKAGRIYVYSTKTGRRLWSADGAPGDELGSGIEAAGDTNGDGVPDVVAGAPGGDYAKVYSGKDGRVLLTLRAEAGDRLGTHVSGVGDVNHDGRADVICGAPASAAGGKGAGRAYVYSGRDGRVLLTLTGGRAGDAFGSSVAGATDGDHTLLVVGAPKAGPSGHGRVFVYDGLHATPKFVIDADETGDALGAMFVSVPGDVDGDGVADVYASDWSNAARGRSTGRVFVHSGKDGRRLLTLTGETAGEGFGTSPSKAGDVDGDGHADLIVGAWQYGGGAAGGGRAYLYSGKDGRLLRTYTCRVPGDTFGFDAVTLGDVDGDGRADFLVTSGWSGVHGHHSGRVFVISSGVTPAA